MQIPLQTEITVETIVILGSHQLFYYFDHTMNNIILKCFLLNYTSQDLRGNFEITLYAVTDNHTQVKIVIDSFRPLFFVPRNVPYQKTISAAERKALPLKGMDGTDVDCLYFGTYSSFLECARQLRENLVPVYESDIHPVDRFLMERFVCGGFTASGAAQLINNRYEMRNPLIRGTEYTPALDVVSLDIETNADTEQIYSIALYNKTRKVFIIGDETSDETISFCRNEKELLIAFFKYLSEIDPDIITGWSIIDYDLRVIQDRCTANSVPFTLGRDRGSRIVQSRNNSSMIARIPGRVVMDVPLMLRSYFHTFEEYSLNFVASEMLGKTKTIELTDRDKIEEINRQFAHDKRSLAQYNLQDTILTWDIFEKAQTLPNAIERSKRSGHLLDRSGGSIAAFDYLYLPHLHREGYVARDIADVPPPTELLPGGFVLEPIAGLYDNVLVLDFRSLYPSIIQTFKIDPLGLLVKSEPRVRGPEGPSFAVDHSILPGIIAGLLEARAQAKKDNNPYLSQAIKILMNSFYGVLGAPSCRFFSSVLATTITRTGQYILKTMIKYITDATPYKVIYGDTDSLFVHIGRGHEQEADTIGENIANDATSWLSDHIMKSFGTESVLKLQYQENFRHFFVPTVRGGNYGSKKHYCGSTVNESGMSLTFKGMESARSDWTDLAKEFQHELYIRFFNGEPLDNYILETVAKVERGECNESLIYKKRLRKDLQEYTVNIPPHVQAAKMLDSPKHIIRYYITQNGPQPIEKLSSPLDFNHYIDCQLRPIADSILETIGKSFDKIVSGQQDLFG